MKKLFILSALIFVIHSCKGDDPAPAVSAGAKTCEAYSLGAATLTSYTGATVTTVGNCGEEYDVTGEVDYTTPGVNSITGYRLLNTTIITSGGNISIGAPGFQASPSASDLEQFGATYSGVDNTTCQNDSSQNGTADIVQFNVTAEFDSNCVPQLRGTFKEYSRCVDNSEVTICSGTITLTR